MNVKWLQAESRTRVAQASPSSLSSHLPVGKVRMYAIALDMDTETLQRLDEGDSWRNACTDSRRVLERHGFSRHQGSVYLGKEQTNAVTCVLAVMDLTRSLPWFAASGRDIRMLRIEEANDLRPAVEDALRPQEQR